MASHQREVHSTPNRSHAESLATGAASAIVDESRQEGSPPSYWGDQEVPKVQDSVQIPQQQWSQPTSQSDNIWANDSESMYSASTQNHSRSLGAASHDTRWYGKGDDLATSTNDIAASMSRLQVSSAAQYNNHYGQDYGGGASISSMPSATSRSIPGVVGVSSGSTGGTSSLWANDSNPHYSQYPMQKQQYQYSNQPLHMPSVPPGFLSPMVASQAAGDDDSVSYDSRQFKKTTKRRKGNRGGGRGRGRGNQNNNYNNNRGNRRKNNMSIPRDDNDFYSQSTFGDARSTVSSKASSEAIRMLIEQPSSLASHSSSQLSSLNATRLPLDKLAGPSASGNRPILPAMEDVYKLDLTEEDEDEEEWGEDRSSAIAKKRDWLLRMNRRMAETPVGQLDPASVPIAAIMNSWAKTKSAQGASMVETWLKRAQQEFDNGNTKIVPSTKMYTMAGKKFVVGLGRMVD